MVIKLTEGRLKKSFEDARKKYSKQLDESWIKFSEEPIRIRGKICQSSVMRDES